MFFVFAFSAEGLAVGDGPAGDTLVFRGASDASAAVAVSEEMFIVADDENNILRIYKTGEAAQGRCVAGAEPVFSYDMTEFLGIEPEHPEADIEGATMVAQRIYWITSHGRNKDGKMRPNRYRFFATNIKIENGKVTLSPVGEPYRMLVHRLLETETMRDLGLNRATRFDVVNLSTKERERLAPKREGLNIEGLCASDDNKTIYIGFRNPRPIDRTSGRAKALVVPLCNPMQVIEKGEAAVFGEPMLWDLGGLGIRSMEYSHFHKVYFIIAGGSHEDDEFAVYRWSGKRNLTPVLVRRLSLDTGKFSPEALVPLLNSSRLLMLSDDGSLVIKVAGAWECMEGEFRKDGTCLNKYLANPRKKTFRGIWLESEDQ